MTSVGAGAGLWLVRAAYRDAALQVCSLVDANYYRSIEPSVRAFIAKCRREANEQRFLLSKAANIKRINARLSELRSSHLSVFDPVENRALWENAAVDTGIRSRFIEEHIVVYEVLEDSPAEKAGVRPGDVVDSVNGETVAAPFEATNLSGAYRIGRRKEGKEDIEYFKALIEPVELQEDLAPTLEDLGEGVGYLKIPSFLQQYFEDEEWDELAASLQKFKKLVVDVRGNAGGSFPAMMRAVSPFRCRAPYIGSIRKPKREGLVDRVNLKNDLTAASQLEALSQAASVDLRAFPEYGCFDGPVTVLMDGDTASTAEVFAQAFYTRPRSRVWGQSSRGEVVLAQWFPLAALGSEAYSLAVPIAAYVTAEGGELENLGLIPQRNLFYDIEVALAGRDNWVEVAKDSQ